jgi:hypothetical protein
VCEINRALVRVGCWIICVLHYLPVTLSTCRSSIVGSSAHRTIYLSGHTHISTTRNTGAEHIHIYTLLYQSAHQTNQAILSSLPPSLQHRNTTPQSRPRPRPHPPPIELLAKMPTPTSTRAFLRSATHYLSSARSSSTSARPKTYPPQYRVMFRKVARSTALYVPLSFSLPLFLSPCSVPLLSPTLLTPSRHQASEKAKKRRTAGLS